MPKCEVFNLRLLKNKPSEDSDHIGVQRSPESKDPSPHFSTLSRSSSGQIKIYNWAKPELTLVFQLFYISKRAQWCNKKPILCHKIVTRRLSTLREILRKRDTPQEMYIILGKLSSQKGRPTANCCQFIPSIWVPMGIRGVYLVCTDFSLAAHDSACLY
jgi:hypothetical protein